MFSKQGKTSGILQVTALSLLLATANAILLAQTLTVLHTFDGSDGQYPNAPLILDSAGNLYGTTPFGSAGYGTIFKLVKAGNYRVLYSFVGSPNDGAYPEGGLLRDKQGTFYGTTWQGGTTNGGTVFKFDVSGKETALHNFVLNSTDGMWPYAGLIQDAKGNLYGTTSAGGISGGGIVFELESTGKEDVLFNFNGNMGNGMYPGGGSLLRTKGSLYGTTGFGGASNLGTVFALHKSKATTVVNFGGAEGEFPFAGLIKDSAGNLYGTTQYGGDLTCHAQSSGCGTVFKLDAKGNETVLYSFLGSPDGDDVIAGLVSDKTGNLYGTTAYGGTGGCQNSPYQGCGTIFKIDPTGKETVLFNFTGGADGKYPYGGVIRDSKGNLYGTAAEGGGKGCGGSGCGTLFKLTP
jgi:uncharacterized repeat protein (TIGR03803 family)